MSSFLRPKSWAGKSHNFASNFRKVWYSMILCIFVIIDVVLCIIYLISKILHSYSYDIICIIISLCPEAWILCLFFLTHCIHLNSRTEKMYHMNASVKFLCKHPSFMKLSDAFAVLGLKLGEKDPTRIRSAYRQQLLQATVTCVRVAYCMYIQIRT